jgi:hypothetical protein
MTGVETGPLALGEILDRMFSIYRKHFLLLIAIAGIPYGGFIVVIGFFGGLAALIGSRGLPDSARVGVPAAAGVIFIVIMLLVVILLFGIVLASLGTFAAVWDIQVGRKPSIRAAYRVAWHHLGAAIVAGILMGLAVAAGFLLLIIPGIIVWLALSLANPVIIAENSGGAASLSRSWALTKGYRWKIFVASLVASAVTMAITYGIQIPVWAISAVAFPKDSAPIWFAIISGIASILGAVIPAPLIAIASCLIYYDARVRKEGFDLQRLLDELPPAVPSVVAGNAPGIAIG